MSENNKQMPFRYPEALETDIEEIKKNLPGYGEPSKNKAVQLAVMLTAGLIKKAKREANKAGKAKKGKTKLDSWEVENKIKSAMEKILLQQTGVDTSHIYW